MNFKRLSVAGYAAAVLSALALLFRGSLLAEGCIGAAVQVLAAMLMLWARITFRGRSFHLAADPTEGVLITSGPYRYLRHPIYASALYFIWAGIISHASPPDILPGLCATGGLFVRMLAEERLLSARYPEYADYAASVKRVIPFIL